MSQGCSNQPFERVLRVSAIFVISHARDAKAQDFPSTEPQLGSAYVSAAASNAPSATGQGSGRLWIERLW
jgi:hypothetical protein